MKRNDTSGAIGLDRNARDRVDGERTSWWRRTLSVVFTIAVVAGAAYLWPAVLGGSTRIVIVSGTSMEPTYDLRDIVVVRDAEGTRIGDVVVFGVPEGEAEGMLVIHRVLKVDDDGFFITQGDNRTTPDQWQLTEDHIVGKPLLHIPKAGSVLGFIQNVWVIALLAGLAALCLLWPDEKDELDEPEDEETSVATSTDDTDAFDRDAIWSLVDSPSIDSPVELPSTLTPAAAATPAEIAEIWLDGELGNRIDANVMADAMAWLDEQLEQVEQLASH